MVKQSREEIAYDKFVAEIAKHLQLDDPDLTTADIEEIKAEFSAEGQIRTSVTQALNAFLWEQDEKITAAIRKTYVDLKELIIKKNPYAEQDEEPGEILQLIDELIEAEDTEEELLSVDDLKELTSEDDSE